MHPSTEHISDEELALEAQAGSRRCFEELVARFSPKIFHFLQPKISSLQDIEDIIQETFFKLYRNMVQYDSNWKFSTWIYTAANRMAISHYRTKQRRVMVSMPMYITSDPAEKLEQERLSQNIWREARNLKPDQYEALWLRYVEDMSSKEIAKVMRKTNMAVRILLHRARLNLAKQFQPGPGLEKEAVFSNQERKNLHYRENRG